MKGDNIKHSKHRFNALELATLTTTPERHKERLETILDSVAALIARTTPAVLTDLRQPEQTNRTHVLTLDHHLLEHQFESSQQQHQ